jgi:hypothetical protein
MSNHGGIEFEMKGGSIAFADKTLFSANRYRILDASFTVSPATMNAP